MCSCSIYQPHAYNLNDILYRTCWLLFINSPGSVNNEPSIVPDINQEILVCIPCPHPIPADQLAFIPSPKPKRCLTHMFERLSGRNRFACDTYAKGYSASVWYVKGCDKAVSVFDNLLGEHVGHSGKRWGKSWLECNSKITKYGYLATTNQTCPFIYTTVIHQNTVYTLSKNI